MEKPARVRAGCPAPAGEATRRVQKRSARSTASVRSCHASPSATGRNPEEHLVSGVAVRAVLKGNQDGFETDAFREHPYRPQSEILSPPAAGIYSKRTHPVKPRSSSICLRSASKVLSSCRSMVTEKSIPIFRSVPLRNLGRILVPSRFQISGGTSP